MSIYLSYYLDMKRKFNFSKKLPSLKEIKTQYVSYLLNMTKNDLEETAKILNVPKESLLKNIEK
jgi:hypothetical protein